MKTIHVDIDKSNMMAKLVSDVFYDSWHVFIRELLQNAFDACYTKQALDWSWGTEFLEIEQAESLNSLREPYKAKITITYDSSQRVFSIEDNGIGINESDLEKYVTRLGESFYTSEDFEGQHLNYQPISRHGMGLLSCFMVARGILIDSKKDHAINTAWNIKDPEKLDGVMAKWYNEGADVEYVYTKRKNPGTKITLPLKAEIASQIDMDFLLDTIRYYTMYQPIPIKVICDGEVKVLYQAKPSWEFKHMDVLGITAIPVDNDNLEGHIVIFNKRYKDMYVKSEIFQQNIRVTEYEDSLKLRPEWLCNFAFYLNIKKRMLNINMSRTNAVKDARLQLLREMIGNLLLEHFAKNPTVLGQYMADGDEPMLSGIAAEEELISRAMTISIFIKGKEVDVPIRTFLNGFSNQKIKIAVISKTLFDYYKASHPFDFKQFVSNYNAIVFEPNYKVFMQFIVPHTDVLRYVIGDTPGIIYTEIHANMAISKKQPGFNRKPVLYPDGCDNPNVFCLVDNERTAPFEIILNPYNRNAQLLFKANDHIKVRNLQAIILENIKQKIRMSEKRNWDAFMDYGGIVVDEWNSQKPLSLQSVWCLEETFAESLNTLVASRLSPAEIAKYGLAGLYFSNEDFISWWLPPQ